MKTFSKTKIKVVKLMSIPNEPTNVSDLKIGDKVVLDWEGKLDEKDIRIGKIVSIDNGYPKIKNQFGNYSQGNNWYPNIKYYKL